MARKNSQSLARRKREQARQERAAQRRAKKHARARSSSSGQPGDPDFEDVSLGPQPTNKASAAEVQAAVERAMNPGAQFKRRREHNHSQPTLFVGNLDYGTGEHELRELFVEAGFAVAATRLVKDRLTGQPKGFAFVELARADDAPRAIETFDGTMFAGRALRVNAADRGGRS